MHFIIILITGPFFVSAALEYAVCRWTHTKLKWLRAGPPVLAVILLAAALFRRSDLWSSETGDIVPVLLFFPGLPAVSVFLGLLAGGLFWRRMWLPRVIRGRAEESENQGNH